MIELFNLSSKPLATMTNFYDPEYVGNCSIKLNTVSGTLITYTHPVPGPFSQQSSSCHLNYQLKGENKFIK